MNATTSAANTPEESREPSTEMVPRTGAGHFQWNTGGWFGGQLGGTAWMLVGAGVLAALAPGHAAIWLSCFLVANLVGLSLWRRRDRLSPYVAIQLLLGTCGVVGLVALGMLEWLRPDAARQLSGERRSLFALGIVPLLMTWFAIMEYLARARKAPERAAPAPSEPAA